MTRIRSSRQAGLTLIELMLALLLGLLVSAGIVTVFITTSKSNRTQTQLALLQEEGRYAVTQLRADLSMANGQYCSNSGGNAHPGSAGPYLDSLRAPTVYASALTSALSDLTTPWGGSYPAAPTAAYSLPPFFSMRGYDCPMTGCTPIDPSSVLGSLTTGTAIGRRVVGTSVLSVRYVDPSRGWAIGSPGGSSITANANGTLTFNLVQQINPAPQASEPPITDFGAGDLAMLADCSNAQIFAVTGQGSSAVTSIASTANFAQPSSLQSTAAPKLFDFNRDYQTVTYYLKVVANADGTTTTGALIRRVNGTDQELVRGVERLDFKYGVEDANGNTLYLSAAQVDSTTTNCPPALPLPLTPDTGCMWRAIKSIEVSILMDGQVPLYTLAPSDLLYVYTPDGSSGGTAPTAPESHGIKPNANQGFPDAVLRREFTVLVSTRNYNP